MGRFSRLMGVAVLMASVVLTAACGGTGVKTQPAAPQQKQDDALPTQAPPKDAPKPAKDLKTIKLYYPAISATWLPVIVADEKGFLAEAGLKMEYVQAKTPVIAAALVKGEADYTTIFTSAIAAALSGVEVKGIAGLVKRPPHVLVVNPKKIQKPEDLRGKKVAVDSLTGATAVEAKALLEKYKIPRDTVTFLVLNNNRLAAMDSGAVDAAIIPVPSNFEAENAGYVRLLELWDLVPYTSSGLATSDNKIKQNFGEVVSLLTATLRGIDFIMANQAETEKIMQKRLELSPEDAVKMYKIVKATISDNAFADKSGVLNEIEEWKEAKKSTEQIPMTKVVNWDPLRAALKALNKPVPPDSEVQ